MSGLRAVVWLWEVEPGALELDFAKRQTKLALRIEVCVMHVPLSGNPRLYLAKGVKKPSQLSFGSAYVRTNPREVEIVPFGSERRIQ
jgi:hypothetical protein